MLELVVLNPPKGGAKKKGSAMPKVKNRAQARRAVAAGSARRRGRRSNVAKVTGHGFAPGSAPAKSMLKAGSGVKIGDKVYKLQADSPEVVARAKRRATALARTRKSGPEIVRAMRMSPTLTVGAKAAKSIKKTKPKATKKKATTKKKAASKKTTRKTTKRSSSRTTKKKTTRRASVAKKKSTKKKATRRSSGRRTTKKRTTKKRTAARRPATKKKTKRKTSAKRRRTGHGGTKAVKSRARRFKATNRRRKAAGKRALPRKKKITVYAGRGYSKKRRHKLGAAGYTSPGGRLNPGRKKKRHRNPLPSAKSVVRSMFSQRTFKQGSHFVLGLVAADVGGAYLCKTLEGFGVPSNSAIAKLGCIAAAGMGSAALLASVQPAARRGGVMGFFQGGHTTFLAATAAVLLVRGIKEFVPGYGDFLPSLSGMGDFVELRGMGDFVELRGMGANGYPGQYGARSYDPYGARGLMGMGDMGSATSPEALIAGESFARSVQSFAGMGQGGDTDHYRLPLEQVRAPGQLFGMDNPGHGMDNPGHGMGNFLETLPGSALAHSAFQPAMESF